MSVSRVLEVFRPCFTAPSFNTFTALVAGLVAQPVGRTVCGTLTGAGLARYGTTTAGHIGSSPGRGGAHDSSGW